MDLSFGLDIGSRKIKLAVAEVTDSPRFAWGRIVESRGLRRGVVRDRVALKNTLIQLLEETENALNQPVAKVVVGANLEFLAARQKGSVLVASDRPISRDDVNRATDSARAGALPANRSVLACTPVSFTVDHQVGIEDPEGERGSRLEAEILMLTCASPLLAGIADVLDEAGWDAERVTLATFGGAHTVLTKRDRELGCLLIDFGCEGTTVFVYSEGRMVWAEMFKVGSASITNDLAVGIPVGVDVAEEVKIAHGSAWVKDISRKEKIMIEDEEHPRKEVAEIISARMEEILEMIRQSLKHLGLDKKLPGGVICIGGGAKLPGTVKLARKTLSLPVRIASHDALFGIDSPDNYDLMNAFGLSLTSDAVTRGGGSTLMGRMKQALRFLHKKR